MTEKKHEFNELREQFNKSLPEPLQSRDDNLEVMLTWLLAHELASNEEIYDQKRYDLLYEGINRAFGWSRVELHKSVLEAKSMLKSYSDPAKVLRKGMTERSIEVLLEVLKSVVLSSCEDESFQNYLVEKVSALLEG
jgi:hypothetical protein